MEQQLKDERKLERETCYQALTAHDARFDGVFFVAVKSTRIYCRNVCRAKLPRLENCTFFAHAAQAEAAGYRPCLRCRPELAPGQAPVDSVNRLASIALNRIEDGALTDGSLENLAREMGISSRHLRRVVEAEFGVSPLQLAQTQRLLLAKRLLTDTRLPVIEIAFAAGFSSVRRFNANFRERYSLSPTDLRKRGLPAQAGESLRCELAYRPPYDWLSILEFLRIRACPAVEIIEDGKYKRTVSLGEHKGWLVVEHNPEKHVLVVTISLSLAPALLSCLARVKRLFDLQVDVTHIERHLKELSGNYPGLRVPGGFDGFEIATRAILGQQVSVKAATSLAGRLAARFGSPVETPYPSLTHTHPTAERLAQAAPEEFNGLGIMPPRIVSIIAVARAVAAGEISLQPGADVEIARSRLQALPGVGEWTAEYIAMRALSWPDAFPHSDLGIKKAMQTQKAGEILALAEKWRPWRSYAAMHLWKSLDQPIEINSKMAQTAVSG